MYESSYRREKSNSSQSVFELTMGMKEVEDVASLVETASSGCSVADDLMGVVKKPLCDACPHCRDCCQNEDCAECLKKASLDSTVATTGCPPGKCRSPCNTYYTMCQIRRHNTRDSCWLVAGATVYDATPILEHHPGGMDSILRKGGGVKDCTVDIQFHSRGGRDAWKRCIIGKVKECGSDENQATENRPWKFPWFQ